MQQKKKWIAPVNLKKTFCAPIILKKGVFIKTGDCRYNYSTHHIQRKVDYLTAQYPRSSSTKKNQRNEKPPKQTHTMSTTGGSNSVDRFQFFMMQALSYTIFRLAKKSFFKVHSKTLENVLDKWLLPKLLDGLWASSFWLQKRQKL